MKHIIFIFVLSIFIPIMVSHQTFALQTKECTACHISHSGGPVKKPLTELCVTCHRERIEAGEHKVDIIPKFPVPKNLPLTKDGKITCITCHDQHSTDPLMLRMETIILCNQCHKK
ncbi:cytochrome c3 family protein [Dissulfurispira thermophila]|uniref:cytochrome c3 family protein n=1 Tax=Dissulfurispira thermophila TaxID=2715679 RepID=UPI00193DBAE6|nr:cytochrome c3 family protein [Dissulfurispira thermophila]